MLIKEELDKRVSVVEDGLNRLLPELDGPQSVLRQAMRYSLLGGGKRLRPVLLLEFCRICGGNCEAALNFACAIEMIHTYSLIHDDLPCMDDDDLRRGRPTCHKMFGEATAMLAGDALLTKAFEVCLCAETVASAGADTAVAAADELGRASGDLGMAGGQMMDLAAVGSSMSDDDLKLLQSMKTGALIRAACRMGCIAAGASKSLTDAAGRYAEFLGLAFQIRDDMLDMYGSAEMLGKNIGSDARLSKPTFASSHTREECAAMVEELTNKALHELSSFGNTEFLSELTIYLASREN